MGACLPLAGMTNPPEAPPGPLAIPLTHGPALPLWKALLHAGQPAPPEGGNPFPSHVPSAGTLPPAECPWPGDPFLGYQGPLCPSTAWPAATRGR